MGCFTLLAGLQIMLLRRFSLMNSENN
ncbi:hypothetical protein F383_22784 [Gossypium arboreum]|uniref:Uncharacterized protein n=2 Tax=Gossypium arboreum TaxID=29729 RepID=A0A0B0NUF8_GOSAR|nr:hypothetical protein F383_22784 [Gossypium arboreum]